ncbi:acyl-CoA dehydrogenase [Streptomyces sp. NRRL S-118]|uniref:acyl-CoA dehydrogenase n=1 Tax=Streptomyces sp. NRRL S-118 TaxID=1463881 RepID=UPI000A63C2B3|nr:acyl-CoA dehydrogenase [Streptomyces sp. NRRL S-118]
MATATTPTPAEAVDWPRVTREVADDLAVDASVRDRAGGPPFDEAARLREAGLPALLTPPAPDGTGDPGAAWRSACATVRELSAADGSIGELLAHHCVLAWSARFLGAPAEPFERRIAEDRWLLAGGIELPEAEAGPGLTAEPGGNGGYVLRGRRGFDAGVTVADRLVVGARCTRTGDLLVVLVDPAHPGVCAEPAGDRVGQRLTGSGTVGFDDVPAGADDVLGAVPRDEHAVAPCTALAPLALRLMLTQVALGVAEGALAEARDVSRAAQAARPSGTDAEDPYLLLAYGELATAAHTAAAVVERATDALARGLGAGAGLDVDGHAGIAVLVAAAEAVTSRSAVHITTRVLELTDGAGFDRFWRNARVLTAHTSSARRLREVGDHYLNGTLPRLPRL